MRYCDFSKAKAGDKVWNFTWGWGIVDNMGNQDCQPFPLCVHFDGIGIKTFDFEGRLFYEPTPTLFWNEFKIPKEAFEKPKPKLEVDTPVWVWDNCKSEKLLRFFSHFNNGRIYTFSEGRDSSYKPSARISWNYWELYKPKNKD